MAEADPSADGLIKTPGYIIDRKKVLNPLWAGFPKLESYDSITNQMLLMEAYELSLGIQPTEDPSPITLSTMNECTDVIRGGILDRTYERIIKAKVFELTGLDIKAFLQLPTYEAMAIMRVIGKIRKEEHLAELERQRLAELEKQNKR